MNPANVDSIIIKITSCMLSIPVLSNGKKKVEGRELKKGKRRRLGETTKKGEGEELTREAKVASCEKKNCS